jgi:hypothetical protein
MGHKVESKASLSQCHEIVDVGREFLPQFVDVYCVRIDFVLVEIPRVDSKALCQLAALQVPQPTIKNPPYDSLAILSLVVMRSRIWHVLSDFGAKWANSKQPGIQLSREVFVVANHSRSPNIVLYNELS